MSPGTDGQSDRNMQVIVLSAGPAHVSTISLRGIFIYSVEKHAHWLFTDEAEPKSAVAQIGGLGQFRLYRLWKLALYGLFSL